MKLGIFGQREYRKARWVKLGKDTLLFPQVLDIDRRMWTFVVSFHLAGIVLFIGHLRLIFEFKPLANALGERMEPLAFLTGGAIGIILLISVLYLLIRRLTPPVRNISSPGDYFLLILVLSLIVTGENMRFFGDIPITAYRQYVNSLLSFNPYIPTGLNTPAARWSLAIHLLLANMLIIYLPLSRMMHFVGSFATNLIRNEYLWMSSYKRP